MDDVGYTHAVYQAEADVIQAIKEYREHRATCRMRCGQLPPMIEAEYQKLEAIHDAWRIQNETEDARLGVSQIIGSYIRHWRETMQPAARFRKQPVVIEAMPFDGTWASAKEILEWMEPERPIDRSGARWSDRDGGLIHINTLEGEMTARAGWWVIRGVKGEFYPCAPDIFDATYDPA